MRGDGILRPVEDRVEKSKKERRVQSVSREGKLRKHTQTANTLPPPPECDNRTVSSAATLFGGTELKRRKRNKKEGPRKGIAAD